MLALQGSFPLHVRALERSGVEAREVRTPRDLEGIAALIVPGGESTTLAILAREYGLLGVLRELGQGGLPIFGTCAGAILLGKGFRGKGLRSNGEGDPPPLGLVDVEVERNAYGRQVDSFSADVEVAGLDRPFHAVFIRAPKFHPRDGAGIEVLARHGDDPVLLRSGAFLLSAFHPELTDDLRIHRIFLDMTAER